MRQRGKAADRAQKVPSERTPSEKEVEPALGLLGEFARALSHSVEKLGGKFGGWFRM